MSWKIKPEDLLLNHLDNKFGSRLSLGRFSAAAVIKKYGDTNTASIPQWAKNGNIVQ